MLLRENGPVIERRVFLRFSVTLRSNWLLCGSLLHRSCCTSLLVKRGLSSLALGSHSLYRQIVGFLRQFGAFFLRQAGFLGWDIAQLLGARAALLRLLIFVALLSLLLDLPLQLALDDLFPSALRPTPPTHDIEVLLLQVLRFVRELAHFLLRLHRNSATTSLSERPACCPLGSRRPSARSGSRCTPPLSRSNSCSSASATPPKPDDALLPPPPCFPFSDSIAARCIGSPEATDSTSDRGLQATARRTAGSRC